MLLNNAHVVANIGRAPDSPEYLFFNSFLSRFSFDVLQVISRVFSLNKWMKLVRIISKNLDLSCLKSKESTRKPSQK